MVRALLFWKEEARLACCFVVPRNLDQPVGETLTGAPERGALPGLDGTETG